MGSCSTHLGHPFCPNPLPSALGTQRYRCSQSLQRSFKCVSAVGNCASSFTSESWTSLFLTINPLEVIYPLQCSPFQVTVSTRRSSGFGCEPLVLSLQSLLSMDCPCASDGFQMAGGLGTWLCHPMGPPNAGLYPWDQTAAREPRPGVGAPGRSRCCSCPGKQMWILTQKPAQL